MIFSFAPAEFFVAVFGTGAANGDVFMSYSLVADLSADAQGVVVGLSYVTNFKDHNGLFLTVGPALKTMVVCPILIWSPGVSWASVMRSELTKVPLALPVSTSR